MASNTKEEIDLIAHLFRRAGFGATRDELEAYVAKGYEATVEELLYPIDDSYLEKDVVDRYWIDVDSMQQGARVWWLYRMINSRSPLQEKMTLFWHGLFATASEKVMNGGAVAAQIEMFRRDYLGNFRDLLVQLSQDPAMILWLDNNTNHKGAPNENYGRELLELFSMGVGNYTEDDVKACTRALTGWTIANQVARYPWGGFDLEFEYRPEDHDDGEKEFLGHTGRFDGGDIIDIIVKQPATARFIAGKLYNFFVSDDPPTEEAIQALADVYFQSNHEIRSVMRALLNSDFFKEARFAKVKSPTEVVAGILRLVGDYREPKPGLMEMGYEAMYMGQELLNPPSVEGWHTGKEWIDSGALVNRVNFAADQVGNLDHPGIQAIVRRLSSHGASMSPEELVDRCLDLIGPLKVLDETRSELVRKARRDGEARFGTTQEKAGFARRVAETLQLIVATREFQFA